MKKSYLLLSLFFIAQWSQAQIVNIPDANFKNALINTNCVDFDDDGILDGDADTNDDGEIQLSEALNVTGIEILGGWNIENVIGIEAFTNLKSLELTQQQIINIDLSQNTQLETIDLRESGIESIDLSYHPNLIKLDVSGNWLSTLDVSQNINLERLNCSFNEPITSIDVTNNVNLKSFSPSGTFITEIDVSQNVNLENFSVQYTFVTSVDLRNNPLLETIEINGNQNLEVIFLKNGSIAPYTQIGYGGQPVQYICVDPGEAQIFDDSYISVQAEINSNCSSVPTDPYISVTGTARIDTDANGCDATDIIVPNMKYRIQDGTTSERMIADPLGNYEFFLTEEVIYTITPELENPTYFTVTPSSRTFNIATATDNFTAQDFCVTPNGTYNDVAISIIPLEPARPGFDAPYEIKYKNNGTTALSGTVQLTFDDDLMDVVTANPMADTQAVHALSWDYTNLEPFETRSILFSMNINTPTEVPAVNGGAILNFEAIISPTVADETPEDNTMLLQQTVVNSFDPNDIRCLEGETITTDEVGEYVHYMIRFENTGTASAVNVVVANEIDVNKFDISTLRPVSSSHEMVTNIKNGNEVEFIFENINLPFDDATNDGYIVFKIKTRYWLQEGHTFDNTADIYFDFNPPITTNTAITTIANPLSVAEENLEAENISIYPNPTNETLYIKTKESITAIEIRTLDGRLVQYDLTQTSNNHYEFNLSKIAAGIYLMNITTTNGKTTKKIIKY